jgi:hypothetical protein
MSAIRRGRALVAVTLVTASLFGSACRSSSPYRVVCPSDGSASTAVTGISGLLEHASNFLKGGGRPGKFDPGPLHPVRGGILVYRVPGPIVARSTVGSSGRFRISLAPGRYRLVGVSGPWPPGANGGTDPFDVQTGCFTSINVTTVTYLP